jgi:hypothetical protein
MAFLFCKKSEAGPCAGDKAALPWAGADALQQPQMTV